ncbi:hypothetical protein HMPREF3036_01471 [Sutterella sp. KLE1602]|nr:hypothetical protein HMPREF3036_01471 [Sutterella sp. KLE1602]
MNDLLYVEAPKGNGHHSGSCWKTFVESVLEGAHFTSLVKQ